MQKEVLGESLKMPKNQTKERSNERMEQNKKKTTPVIVGILVVVGIVFIILYFQYNQFRNECISRTNEAKTLIDSREKLISSAYPDEHKYRIILNEIERAEKDGVYTNEEKLELYGLCKQQGAGSYIISKVMLDDITIVKNSVNEEYSRVSKALESLTIELKEYELDALKYENMSDCSFFDWLADGCPSVD